MAVNSQQPTVFCVITLFVILYRLYDQDAPLPLLFRIIHRHPCLAHPGICGEGGLGDLDPLEAYDMLMKGQRGRDDQPSPIGLAAAADVAH